MKNIKKKSQISLAKLLLIGSLAIFTACGHQIDDTKKMNQHCQVLVQMQLTPEIDGKSFLDAVVKACNALGKTSVIQPEELFKAGTNDKGIIMNIGVLDLHEGHLPNFGKKLPVIKVSMDFLDYQIKSLCPQHQSDEEYISLQDVALTSQKAVIAFNNIMPSFVAYTRRNYGDTSTFEFVIQAPQILKYQ